MTSIPIMLTINQRSKSIPYPAASDAGSQNFGFRVLKGKLDKIGNIQEAKNSQCIQEILRTLNADDSPFFSVGCEKAFNEGPNGHWAKGYIEFAFNYSKLVTDATYYFPLFFHFNKHATDFLPHHDVQFWWDLQPANFVAAKCVGFSCCVWVTTGMIATSNGARNEWESAVTLLSSFLRAAKQSNADPIY